MKVLPNSPFEQTVILLGEPGQEESVIVGEYGELTVTQLGDKSGTDLIMFFLKLKNSGDVFVDIKMGIYKSKTNFIGPEGPKAHANKTSINSMINISRFVNQVYVAS